MGGFGNSQAFTAIDVRDPSAMKIARTLEDPSYRQLVGQIAPERPNHLFVALWDDPGGLGAFDVTNPARGDVLIKVADLSRAETARARFPHQLPRAVACGCVAVHRRQVF